MSRCRTIVLVCAALSVCTALLVAAPANAAFTPELKRKLALVVRNDMTDSRLPGVGVGVWQPGHGSWGARVRHRQPEDRQSCANQGSRPHSEHH
jgi:hypothetical protein